MLVVGEKEKYMSDKVPEKRGKFLRIPEIIVFFILICILVLAVVILNGGSESRTSINVNTNSIGILDCKSENPTGRFFSYESEKKSMHEVKIAFDDDGINKLSYTYTGNFSSNEEVVEALSSMHADYNKYMGTKDTYQEDLTPTFSPINLEAIINLYINEKTFNYDTARFVFLTDEEYAGIKTMSTKSIEKLYSGKGFSCKFSE